MIGPLAIVIVAVLAAIALLHLSWAFGQRWPGVDEVSLAETVGGLPPGSRMHPPAACVLVASLIGIAAVVVAVDSAGVLAGPAGALVRLAYLALVAVFGLRGAAGFVPALWRRTQGTPFHRLNRLYYSPLCLLIAAGLIANLVRG